MHNAGNASSPFDLTASPPRNDKHVVVPVASPRKSPPKKKPPNLQGTMYRFFGAPKRGKGRPKKSQKHKPQSVVLYTSKKEEKNAKAAAAKAAAAKAAADIAAPPSAPVAPKTAGKNKAQTNAPSQPKLKKTRINWSKGEAHERLVNAVSDWDNNTGDKMNDNGEPLPIAEFCFLVGIPRSTFEKYIRNNKSKRREIGKGAGRPALLPKDSVDIIQDSLARADRANDGFSRKDAIDAILLCTTRLMVL